LRVDVRIAHGCPHVKWIDTPSLWLPRCKSGAAVTGDGQDDVACLLPCLDVPRRLDHLLQRVDPIDDGAVLARLDELLEDEEIRLCVARDAHDHSLVADPVGQERQERRMQHEPRVRFDKESIGFERPAAAPEGGLAHGVEDDVIRLAAPDELLARVVDHPVRAERADQLDILCPTNGGDLGADGLGHLHRRAPDGARGAIDQQAPSRSEIGVAQAGERSHRAIADRRRLLKRHAIGHLR